MPVAVGHVCDPELRLQSLLRAVPRVRALNVARATGVERHVVNQQNNDEGE